MKLTKHTHFRPVHFEGEGGIQNTNFLVGGSAGAAIIEGIEATPLGIILRRSGAFYDVLLSPCGESIIEEKQRREPAQLKGAR